MPETVTFVTEDDLAPYDERLDALEAAPPPSGGGGGTDTRVDKAFLWVADYPGNNDDEKFDNAWAQQRADTIKRPLALDPSRVWHLNKPGRVLSQGFKWRHPGYGEHKRGANTTSSDVRTSLTGPVFICPDADVFDVEICGLSFQSDIPAAEFIRPGAGAIWTSTMVGLGFNGYRHVLGNPNRHLAIDGCVLDDWNVNNGDGTAITIAGSDNTNLWQTCLLLDTPKLSNFIGKYHCILSYMAKSNFGAGAYITGEGAVSSLLIKGGPDHDELVVGAGVFEGHLEGRPANSANVRVESGGVTFRDSKINFGGLTGYMDVAGGDVRVLGVSTRLANNANADTPFINHTGGRLRVRDVNCTKGHLPVVRSSSKNTLNADDSVKVV